MEYTPNKPPRLVSPEQVTVLRCAAHLATRRATSKTPVAMLDATIPATTRCDETVHISTGQHMTVINHMRGHGVGLENRIAMLSDEAIAAEDVRYTQYGSTFGGNSGKQLMTGEAAGQLLAAVVQAGGLEPRTDCPAIDSPLLPI